jgi:hypothetical protein
MAPFAARHFILWAIALCLGVFSSASAAEPATADVPLERVVLFNSGVGFFEHAGDIDGDRQVELKFNVDDVNDLLKSMVLRDLGGGRISTVAYASKDPITKTLRTFAIDLTRETSIADLLRQIRGETIEVTAPLADAVSPITGTILGVEHRSRKTSKDEVEEFDVINLLTRTGLRSVNLQQAIEIRLVDPRLNEELRQALAILAMAHATDKKTVTISFLGDGKRPVRIGYIQEAPIWKTSYRLVLKDQDPPFLQGWAIVENTTEHDWAGVNLTLVSGRPISFIMDLYQPLYLNRPVVVPELFASLTPRVYDQDLADRAMQFEQAGRLGDASGMANGKPIVRKYAAGQAGAMGGGMGGMGGGFGGMGGAGGSFGGPTSAIRSKRALDELQLQRGVSSSASAENVGELFRYVIDTPVTIKRQQSAMLPIVNDSVKGEKLSIYNAQVHRKHPLNGLRLTNSTALHLMQGPITVFDGGEYAGDARIEDLAPGSERLLSYALDLDTEVAPENKMSPQELVSARIVKGTLLTNFKLTRSQEYVVKNSGAKAKKLLVEYPIEEPWKLVSPEKPSEKTRGMYRFALTAEPRKPATLVINEEQLITQQLAVTNLDQDAILLYVRSKAVSQAVKDMLAEIVSRKQSLATLVSQREQLQSQLQAIDSEQARIRENMDRLDRNSELYQRYVKKFVEQEDRVEELRRQTKTLVDEETRARRALDDYMASAEVQ